MTRLKFATKFLFYQKPPKNKIICSLSWKISKCTLDEKALASIKKKLKKISKLLWKYLHNYWMLATMELIVNFFLSRQNSARAFPFQIWLRWIWRRERKKKKRIHSFCFQASILMLAKYSQWRILSARNSAISRGKTKHCTE